MKRDMKLAERYRRQGYAKAMKAVNLAVLGWQNHYKRMYAMNSDEADKSICLGRVFASDDIGETLEGLMPKRKPRKRGGK